jgi:hypothetical protein
MPLIATTVVFHAFMLQLLNRGASLILRSDWKTHAARMSIVGGFALCATVLHGLDAAVWAIAYCLLGALPDRKGAMLYSLSAMTTYGNTGISLKSQWQLMGSLEALNGWILFGLTTAFLLTVVQEVWAYRDPSSSKRPVA